MTIDFKSPVVLRDLEYICELAERVLTPADASWATRITHYRTALCEEIERVEFGAG